MYAQLGTVETEIRHARQGQQFAGAPSQSQVHMKKSAAPAMFGGGGRPMAMGMMAKAKGEPSRSCADDDDDDDDCGKECADGEFEAEEAGEPQFARSQFMSKSSSSSLMRRRSVGSSAATGCPRIEHLSAAAALCANNVIEPSGVAAIKLPEDSFDGAALVMLTGDLSCEWRIVHVSSSQPAPPPSLLQRHLCLTQPFSPDTHMTLQVSAHCVSYLAAHSVFSDPLTAIRPYTFARRGDSHSE
jgi:hypothetical protein